MDNKGQFQITGMLIGLVVVVAIILAFMFNHTKEI